MNGVIAERYALGAMLGRGGTARVFAAHDQRLGRTVALKLVPAADAEPVLRQRFIREARSAAGFSHPNAVAVFDAGESDGYLYLVMELVSGRSLADRLAEGGPLDPAAASTIAIAVLRALGAAHAVGIVHRDVKPANVLLADDGGVKLADFGIAKRLDDVAGDVTMAGEVIGTPKYLAPELMAGLPATAASDVYAVGVVLFEMLAGRPPFDAETPMATALAHRVAPVPDIDAERSALPAGLGEAIRRAMAKDPADRFGSARAMLDTIASGTHRASTSPAVGGRPPQPTQVMPAGGYTRSPVTRRWVLLAASLIAGAAVLGVLVVRDDTSDGADPQPSGPAVSTSPSSLPSTVAPTIAPTTPAPTTVVPTAGPTAAPTAAPAPAPTAAPTDIDGVAAALDADREAYGPRAGDVIDGLDAINGNGRSAQKRAADLLGDARAWVDAGELSPDALALLAPVLGAIAGDGGGDEHDEDDEDDD